MINRNTIENNLNFNNKMKRQAYTFVTVFVLLAALSLGSINLWSQTDGSDSPQGRETANKADKNLKSVAKVNPSTLAMEMSLPLMSYPGRNGNSLLVGFNYSSKVWRMDNITTWWFPLPFSGVRQYVTDIRADYAERAAAGWTSALVPPRIGEDVQMYTEDGKPYVYSLDEASFNSLWQALMQDFDSSSNLLDICQICLGGTDASGECMWWTIGMCWNGDGGGGGGGGGGGSPPPPPPTPLQIYFVRKIHVAMPSGATHEFRESDNPVNCGNTSNDCTISGSGNGTYLSTDGSGMKLVKDDNGKTLFMPDGTRYEFPAISPNPTGGNYATKYFDPDGNALTFSSTTDSQSSQTVNKWIDSLGREVVDPVSHNDAIQRQSPGRREFSLPGLSGQMQNYSMTWSRLKPPGCETSTDPNCVGSGNTTGGALEDQSQKLFYETRYFCRGNLSTDLLANPNNLDDPANEVLFPIRDRGIRPCNSFNVERNANDELILSSSGNAVPFPTRFNPVVLTEVEMPNGKTYNFKYNRYGEITKIVYPSGNFESFLYAWIAPVSGAENQAYDQTNRGVVERRSHKASGELEQRWTYSVGISSNLFKVTTIGPKADSPLGTGIKTERYLVPKGFSDNNFGFDSPLIGMTAEERVYSENDHLNPRSRSVTEWTTKNFPSLGQVIVARDPRVKRTVSITIENGQALATMSETEYDETGSSDPEHFAHLNAKRSKSHNFRNIPLSVAQTGTFAQIAGYFGDSTVATVSETDYLYDANYKARGIASLPIESRTLNPADGSVLSKTQTKYDNLVPNISPSYPSGYTTENYGISGFYDCGMVAPNKCWIDPSTQYLGRPTTSRLWDSDNNVWIETHTRYDIFGNAIAARNPIGNEAATLFENTIAKPYKYAYPTRVDTSAPDPTNTHGTDEGSFATTTYDFMTGLPLTSTNEFGQTTAMEYNDLLLRPTRVYAVNFAAPESQTIYDDNALTVKVRKQIDGANWDEAVTFMDSLGRSVKTQAKDSQGDVFVETKYDFLGRVKEMSNPYRIGDTVLWSKTIYDEMGRAKESFAPAPDGQTGDSLGTTAYDISTAAGFLGLVVTTTDAAAKKSRSITNALGQLVVVDEPDWDGKLAPLPTSTPDPLPTPSGGGGGGGGGGCLSIDNCQANFTNGEYPNYSTFYKYNAQGKMVEVTQGVQKRWFKYDSLGRLLRVRQPEQEINASLNLADSFNTSGQWTAGFTYDILGNVLTATDANGVTITNTYDRANRVKTRTYSGEPAGQTTPTVSFFYDGKGLDTQQSPNFAKGKLTKVSSSVSETRYKLFDNFGRLTESEQRTPVGIETIANAIPRVSKYTYNLSGALVEEEYPSGRKVKNEFEPDGDLLRVYGKANPTATERTYVNSFSYTASGGISQMKLGNGKWENAKFNSRLQMIELGLGNSATDASVWKVNYEYGELNTDGTVNSLKNTGNIARQTLSFNGLAQPFVQNYKYDSVYRLTEAKETSNGNQTWIQNFGYDRYGNRTAFTQNISGIVNSTTPSVNVITNRFTTGQGFVYDFNGNLITDAEGRQFTFNGDNKQTQVKDVNNIVIGNYFYDGEGKRVKKVTDTETTIFVYSANKLIAEYSTQLPQNLTTSYTTTDHLGSPRIITDQLGNIKSRRDFMPFGEDLFNGVGARSESLKYGINADDVKQKFTGYLKDSETNLDFAEARMYENRHARFTAVDPLLASGKSANPQTFNRYIYVGNNPLNITDPTGLDWYSRYNKETSRYDYNWYEKNPGDGWGAVDFGGFGFTDRYLRLDDNFCAGGDCGKGAGYIYKSGGWDYGERANYGLGNAIADTGIGAAKSAWNGIAGVSDLTYGVLGRLNLQYATTGQPIDMPSVRYFEPSNQVQANAGWAMTAVSLSWGAFAKTKTPYFSGFNSTSSATGLSTAVQYEQYALRALNDGFYPVMQRGSAGPVGSVFLKEGDVWKFGQTTRGSARYSGVFLEETGLQFIPEFKTTSFKDVLQIERQKILNYEQRFGTLPPGNKIRR